MQLLDGVRWYKFIYTLPPQTENIVVEDHEGNRAVGLWHNEFINLCDHPIGKLVKWTSARVVEIMEDHGIYFVCYENDHCIPLMDLYDQSPLFFEGELKCDD